MIDDKYTRYAKDVISGKIVAGELVRLACERYMSYFERDDIYFDSEKADKPINFIKHLKHFEGEFKGKPFILQDWQEFMVYAIYGWIRKDNGSRLVRNVYAQDPTIPSGAASEMVSRDNPGKTTLEQAIIRWAVDSDPQGARIFYRVISSIPAVVKNTNETYLQTTPYEETRPFNILGLTYENSRDVQIEFKIVKDGYETQVKRFNVRQALDQQEISAFFVLVKKSN